MPDSLPRAKRIGKHELTSVIGTHLGNVEPWPSHLFPKIIRRLADYPCTDTAQTASLIMDACGAYLLSMAPALARALSEGQPALPGQWSVPDLDNIWSLAEALTSTD